MSTLELAPEPQVTRDPQNGAIRAWFNPPAGGTTRKAAQPPHEAAAAVLRDNAQEFRWSTELPGLRRRAVLSSGNAHSVRYAQEVEGIPVDAAEVVVNVGEAGVHSIYSSFRYDIPAGLSRAPAVDAARAGEAVEALLRVYPQHEIRAPRLIIYPYRAARDEPRDPKHDGAGSRVRTEFLGAASASLAAVRDQGQAPREGEYFLAWDFVATTRNPAHAWRIVVDATTGGVIQVLDLLQYATGTSDVYDPNPVVTTGNTTLSVGTAAATLNAQRVPVILQRLNPPVGGKLHLDGLYVNMQELETPAFAEPENAGGAFSYGADTREFLNAMTYFHIDRFQDYIQVDLSMTNVANFSIAVDPQGLGGADNSHYNPATKILAFGEGGVPDAADAHVILHEYGHAIQDDVNPGVYAGNYDGGTMEGFGDLLAAIYYDDKHAVPAATRGWMMSWDAAPLGGGSWPGRRYDVPWLFTGPEFGSASGHGRGQLWAATIFELYRKLGGDSGYAGVRARARDLAMRLHLIANFHVPTSYPGGTTPQQIAAAMAQQVLAADSTLGGWRYADGLHRKVIHDTFRRRGLTGFAMPAVDVYVNDGREGGYGSPSGNDLFTEKLWDENYWDTQDIWVRATPYASPAAQAASGPGDHVEPPVNSKAQLYVRVKNRGTSAAGSGAVTMRAFHCTPGMGLVWPDAWTPMDTPSINVSNILPGAANGVVVGPFPWTPTIVGHECVLVIVECAADRAVTQDLLVTDHVPHSDLVPFDNNIAQRNLVPTPAKGSKVRGFNITNPDAQVREIELHFESGLPRGWGWRTGLANPRSVRMGPLERRWVELTIEQAQGEPVTRFDEPHTLSVTGTIEGRIIGGMTFYLAPPSAFPAEHDAGGGTDVGPNGGMRRRTEWIWLLVLLLALALVAALVLG